MKNQTPHFPSLAGYLEPLYALGSCTAQLDAVISLAIAAVSAPQQYVRPRFSAQNAEGACIRIRDFRHPCLEMQDGVSVIPNDVHLERGLFVTPCVLDFYQ